MRARGAPVEVGVGEAVVLHLGDQVGARELVEANRPSQARSSARASAGRAAAARALAAVALAEHALGDLEHPHGVELGSLAVEPERPHGQRHRRVRPLLGAALLAARLDAAGPDVFEELRRRRRRRPARERPPDVDPGVVVAAADGDAALRLHIDRGWHVQLRARASRCASPRSGRALPGGGGGGCAAARRPSRTGERER